MENNKEKYRNYYKMNVLPEGGKKNISEKVSTTYTSPEAVVTDVYPQLYIQVVILAFNNLQ